MKRLLAVLAALLMAVGHARAATPPSATIDTPGPYHYAGTITATTHGDYKLGRPDHARSTFKLTCTQNGSTVYTERYDDPIPEQPYTFHFGGLNSSAWDENGGGAALCNLRFIAIDNKPGTVPYTSVDFTAEA